MHCESVLYLIDEVPLSRWTDAQQSNAHSHCSTCDACRSRLEQQEGLFTEFDRLIVPEPSRVFDIQPENTTQSSTPVLGNHPGLLSGVAVMFLCFGSIYQLFMESGFALHWIADGGRFVSAINLVAGSPVLSIVLTLLGLVYCLALHNNNFGEQE